MAKLAQLMGHDHPMFIFNVAQLEKATGNAGIDTRLIADITEQSHRVMRQLGLAPKDTTSQELYNALIAQVKSGDDDGLLADTEYVIALVEDVAISMNFQDIKAIVDQDIKLGDHTNDQAERRLRAELVRRYAEHDRTDNLIVHDLAEEAGLTGSHLISSVKNIKKDGEELMLDQNSQNKPYVLCIGDVFTDAFIKLGDETARIIEQDGVEWLAVPFGRKPPYERVDIVKSVGPSPNVAVSLTRLGLRAGLMAWIGGDDTGTEAVDYLKSERVDTAPMVVEADKATSYWYVLNYKSDRTMLVKSEKYRYEWLDPTTKPDWIYLAYLGEDSWPLHEGLLDYLERNPEIKFAFQPGTFQFQWGAEKLAGLYRRSYVTLMNREEAMEVTGLPYDSIKNLADGLHDMGPEIVVITDGPNGSYVSDGDRVLTIPNYPDIAPPKERTGAGDAFSSTFVAAIAEGETLETALLWSPINSMNVVQEIGAQAGLQTRAQLQEWLAKAPEDYKVSEHQD